MQEVDRVSSTTKPKRNGNILTWFTSTIGRIVISLLVPFVTFIVLWQWTGWHYRFRWLLGAFVGLIGGFSLLLLSTNLGLLVVAQVIFGVSVGVNM